MKRFAQRVFYIALMLWIISIISFIAIHAAPNSFFAAGELNPNMTQESLEHLKRVYGLDKPLFIQYLDWVANMAYLDFGVSFVNGKEVSTLIGERLGITLGINITSLILVFALSLTLGIKAGLNQNSRVDKFVKQLSLVSFSMPSFYLALLLIMFFSVTLKWFPISGLHSLDEPTGVSYYLDMAWHLVIPISVMVFVSIGSFVMYVRSLVVEILKSDYLFFAQSRGIPKNKILRYFILPNLMPPVVTLLGLSLPALIGGSVILESLFSIDGMGLLFYQSALSRDYPTIMGILMITAFLTLLGNILADAILLKLNPYFKKS